MPFLLQPKMLFHLIINMYTSTQSSSSKLSFCLNWVKFLLYQGESGILGPPGPAGAPGLSVSVVCISLKLWQIKLVLVRMMCSNITQIQGLIGNRGAAGRKGRQGHKVSSVCGIKVHVSSGFVVLNSFSFDCFCVLFWLIE